jgi:hypothetical protein
VVAQSVRCGWTQLVIVSRMFANEIARLPKWEIYARAERVVIWLGKASEDSEMAIAFMHKHSERLARNGEFLHMPSSLASIQRRVLKLF